jgi:hypothetical protein
MLDERPSLRAFPPFFWNGDRVPGILRGTVERRSTHTVPFAGQASSINQSESEFSERLPGYFLASIYIQIEAEI